jgi:hypothetical protein
MHYDFDDPRPVDSLYPKGPPNGVGISRRSAIKMGVCVKCAGEAEVFSDYIAEREYQLTGFCGKCQDALYAALREDDE